MTDDRMALIEAMQKADDGNFLRAGGRPAQIRPLRR
jgi:hypothetical protein